MSFETMKVFNEIADNADMNALLSSMLQAKVISIIILIYCFKIHLVIIDEIGNCRIDVGSSF